MKRPGERLTLTYHGGGDFPPADPFEPGNVLETSTGRRYEVIEAGAITIPGVGLTRQRLSCKVLRPGARLADDVRIFKLRWLSRRPRR